jgi:hypothetical protein
MSLLVDNILSSVFDSLSIANTVISDALLGRRSLTDSNTLDDDKYIYKTTGEIVWHTKPSQDVGVMPNGYACARGIKAKTLGLWFPVGADGHVDDYAMQISRARFHAAQRGAL